MLTAFFLGKFEIRNNEHIMNEKSIRSEMLMKLITYLIMNRNQVLTIHDISEALWDSDEIDNPNGALKNLMYRLRTQMKDTFGEDSFFITGRGTYSWNPEIPIQIDADDFEKYSKQALRTDIDREERKSLLEQAITLYLGEFGVKCKDVYWIMTRATYYHSMYLTDVLKLAAMLEEDHEYQKLEKICGEALKNDVTDENLHVYFIKALIGQGKYELANAQLDEAERILKETLGIRHSKNLESLRKELLLVHKNDLLSVQEIFHEATKEEDYTGAFQCSFSIFKEIYRLESRKIDRLGIAEHIGLITANSMDMGQTGYYLATHAADRIEKIAKDTLRSGDTFTRLNDTQILLLLPGCSYEAATNVLARICEKYYEIHPYQSVELKTDIREIEEYHPRKRGE